MGTLIEVSKLSKYGLYRDLIKPVLNLCGKVNYERGKYISVVNKDLCMSVNGAQRIDFKEIPWGRIFSNNYKVGAIFLDEYFTYDALNMCRAFELQVCLYQGINYNYVKVFINYSFLTSNPKNYLSSECISREPISSEFEVYATLSRQQASGRNTILCQCQRDTSNELILVDLKKKHMFSEKDLSRSFIKAMDKILISSKNAIDSIYCITTFKPFGEFKNEVVYYKNENGEDIIVVYYGIE